MAALSPARCAAFQILLAIECGQSHSDDLLRGKAVDALAPSDRNLATALVFGVLRWQIWLDHHLCPLLKRPNVKLDPEVLIALRLGAFQLLCLDRIPTHAAIDESVELAKRAGHRFASNMVNAVLRKLASSQEKIGPDLESRHDFSCSESATKSIEALTPEGIFAAQLALAYAHPAWMVERWVDFYGLEATHAICRHGQSQPTPTVRIASPDVEAELTHAGIQLEPGELLTTARIVISGNVTATSAFEEGRIRVQDEGSQMIAEIAACAGQALDEKVSSIVDMCAAPGGKTLILAERNPEARIVACEAGARRLVQLRERVTAYYGRVECRLADATVLEEDSAFDVALADVPCSGTGTLGRNPEIRHKLHPDDLPRQAERQRAILRAALCAVRSGGCVLYSTCSLEPEENEQVVAAVLTELRGVRQVSLASRIEALCSAGILTPSAAERLRSRLTPEGALRLLPGVFRCDGFFVALIERTA